MCFDRLLSDGTYAVVQPTDLGIILDHIKDAEIVFAGEDRHHIPEVIDVAFRLGLLLADRISMKVFGIESLYGYHPFMEKASLSALSAHEFGDLVVQYNQHKPKAERILMTAIDIEHSIAMPNLRYLAADYLFYLAHRSTSWKATLDLLKAAGGLFTVESPSEIHGYVDQMWELFQTYRSTYSPEDWENISFSITLMHDALEYHTQIHKYGSNAEVPIEVRELRGKGFRQTIERAYLKAQGRASRLYCYVGDVHAFKTPVSEMVQRKMDKWPPATWPEAMYFDRWYEPTKGKVFSILLRTLISHQHGETSYAPKDDLDDMVFERMESADLLYVDLDRIAQEHGLESQASMYFTAQGPVADGVLFFREVGRALRGE
jgi:hypothetical protein